MNWFKKLFKKENAKPAPKTVFFIKFNAYFNETETTEVEVKESQSGYYIETYGKTFILVSGGKLFPQPSYKAEWLCKSGWTLDEMYKFKMITVEEKVDREAELMLKLLNS
jgi:hypothetical protein